MALHPMLHSPCCDHEYMLGQSLVSHDQCQNSFESFCRIFHASFFSSDAGPGVLNNPRDYCVNLFYGYGLPNIQASWQILGSPFCSLLSPSLRLDLSVQTRFSILHRPTCAYPFWSTELTKRFGSCHSAPPNIIFCSRRTHEKKNNCALVGTELLVVPNTEDHHAIFLSKAVL
jgi:hypothetical protein